jgi:hypothetical protein
MLEAPRIDLTIVQGSTWSVQFTLTDSAGAAISLSGAAVHCQLRASYGGELLETATCTITNAAGGIFTVGLSPSETAALSFAQCLYDVLVIYSGGTREYVARGVITLVRRVTEVA